MINAWGNTLLPLQGVDQYVMPIHNPRVTLRSALGYGLLPFQGVPRAMRFCPI